MICGRSLQASGHLPGNRIVATVMSNLGLEVALRRYGISMARTSVGDKYVLEEMLRSGAPLGGEQSGHIIFSEFSTTGDGMLTALRILEAMVTTGKSLDQLNADFKAYPQLLINVRLGTKLPLESCDEVQHRIAACEHDFGSNGRVLVRFSGTEPLARVMVEGDDEQKVQLHAKSIADALQLAMGVK
jgi:phosphoglucosamine mutase